MRTKQDIVENWLPRYTKRKLEDFTKHILLTNFQNYVEIFAEHFDVPILGMDGNMPNASAEGITIINFGMGSANAATIMDLLSAVKPDAVLFLGKCGGLKPDNKLRLYSAYCAIRAKEHRTIIYLLKCRRRLHLVFACGVVKY